MAQVRAAARRWCLRAALFAAGLLAYASALGGVFVFDDVIAIVENPHVLSLWPLSHAAWAEHESPLSGRPVPALSLALNYAVGGLAPVGYKAVNLALHLSCGLALFETVRGALRMPVHSRRFAGRSDSLAFAAALLWLVHPLASECVNYVTQRTESWMALAYLSALACTARAWTSASPGRWRAAAVLACAIGMASKEVMVSAPLAIASFECAYAGESPRALWRKRSGFWAALGACWLLLCALMWASFRSDTVGFDEGVTAATYLWNQAWAIPRYLRLVVWPSGLAHDWGLPRALQFADVWLGFAFTAGLFVAAVTTWLRRPPIGWPLLFGFAVLAPTSSLIPIVTEVAAERRMYLPLAALLALVVVAAAELGRRLGVSPRTSALVLLTLAALLGAATLLRNQVFQSRLTAWESVVAVFPDNARAHTNVGQALVVQQRYDESLAPLRRAIEISPDFSEGHNELGIALAAVGLRSQARAHFERSVELDPEFAKASQNLGVLLADDGDRVGARALLRRSLQLDPSSGKTARALAWLVATDADPKRRLPLRAVALAERALAQLGADARTLDVLAAAHAAAGDFERAVELATRARHRAAEEGRAVLRAEIGGRLAHYERGEGWVDP